MSRALNLNATQDEIRAEAAKRAARITSIEPLYPSGTRVVFANGEAAAAIARAFKSRIVSGIVTRTPLRTKRSA